MSIRADQPQSEAATESEQAKSITPVNHEVLEPVPGYPDYRVSPAGYVVSYKKYKAGQRLKAVPNNRNAYYVSLYRGDKRRPLLLSRIVAKAFLPNPHRLPNVVHKDSDKSNNAVSNLVWSDMKETHLIAFNNGRYKHYKISDSMGAKIIKLYETGATPTALAKKYKVNRQTIYWWIHGKKHWGAYLATTKASDLAIASEDTKSLPVDYTQLTWQERRTVRQQYVREQNGECFYCGAGLNDRPLKDLLDIPIDWSLFPGGKEFLNYPVHLQHNHDTGMTEGAVHSFCNALMWNYERR